MLRRIVSRLKFTSDFKVSREWKDNEYFDNEWKNRISYMAKLINKDTKSIADIGCGRCWLKEFLPQDIEYYSIDYTKRSDSTIICDLNKREFTSLSFDTCFCSGVIEYIETENLRWFFDTLNQHTNILIVSYCSVDLNPSIKSRETMSWKNHLTKLELVKLIESCGFDFLTEIDAIQGNNVFKFKAS